MAKKYKEPGNKKYRLSPFWISAIATALGKSHKVKITRGDKWAMDMVNKTLMYTDDICFLDEDNVLALLLHEIGHLRFSEWYDETTAIYKDAPEAAQNCINACEDIRIDDVMSRQYEGSFSLIDALHRQSVDDGLSKLVTHKEQTKQAEQFIDEMKKNLTEAQMQVKGGSVSKAEYDKFEEDLEQMKPQITGRISPVAECMYVMLTLYYGYEQHAVIKDYEKNNKIIFEKANLCMDEVIKHQIQYFDTTKEIQVFYEEYIYPIIKDLIERDKNGGEKKFENPQQGSSQTKGSPKNGEGNSQKGQGQMTSGEERIKRMVQRSEQRMSDRATNTAKSLNNGSQPEHDRPADGEAQVSYNEFYDIVKDYVNASSSKFSRILKDNKFDRYSGRFRTGELNQRRLYKYKTNDFKLFQRKVERQNKDYAFSIMMDCSGSMNGSRAIESFKGIVLMCEVLNRCKVPYEVSFFSSGYSVGKDFESPLSRMKVGNKASEVWGGGTDIYEPFKKMVGNLSGRKERHKVMVVLTDGQVGGDQESKSVKLIKKNPNIEYYGIGIDCSVDNLFGQNALEVTNVTEIMPKFAYILKKHIKIG